MYRYILFSKYGVKELLLTLEKIGNCCALVFKSLSKKSVKSTELKKWEASGFDSLSFVEDELDYGSSVEEILANREKIDDFLLVSHVNALFMDKESKIGLDSFNESEKKFYIVADMIWQIDSGGFMTYFYNTGHNSYLLEDALNAIGAEECQGIVSQAISFFGKMPSHDYGEMSAELDKITNNFEQNLWDDQDDRFYYLEENLGKLLMDYMQENSDQFSL